ncbi:MerR family transcriptional regulator [Lactobacillus crispatus]|uniref:Methyltransferase domain-containing protein n=1 Tax=Lactobacillus crispatus TaxID=47770 RepID=A0A2N5KZ95_9LACO|nr:methyltransferase domain-containing protein [Lactobacillus crispatus]KAA8788341.1 methyltransferase domain-containing protein [Lactobacillus crispatus]KAA8788351.1 methyltransferase domain-containing protein [Lactobacillus crispatus]MDK7320896.1 methyltransferase domain-containing protein [Lactobacillus crispatus]MDK8273178.1 methyltransferase domain-containing protein [Lactobacillus crispatus]MDK8569377.1 methyltransferase domain-containing protein [Lactobacillus crispatus]
MTKYYTSGEFAEKAHVSIRTIRYYDQKNLLKPAARTKSGARRYTDQDFAKLQQILLLKYLGFSLNEIREMTIGAGDAQFLLGSLQIQKRLAEERLEEMKNVITAIDSTSQALKSNRQVDWSQMLKLIHLTSMNQSLSLQYKNATNISARIRLHRDYSLNQEGWFPWLFSNLHLKPGMKILELGAGNGALWSQNIAKVSKNVTIVLSDISEGILADARKTIGDHPQFQYSVFNAQKIPFADNTFDLVIANHMLFYCDDIPKALQEVQRVLKPDAAFTCSTYSKRHMHEITDLVQSYNDNIVLSSTNLYERFGLDNGRQILQPYFKNIVCHKYRDAIELSDSMPIISYILSCHGNQNSILLDHYQDFKQYVDQQVKDGFHITKDAGFFSCKK